MHPHPSFSRTLLCGSLCASTALGAITPATAQQDVLEQELSILADRFFLRFPKEARNEARSVDIMSAPPGEEEETRIVIDHGEERIVFFARELLMTGPAKLVAGWKEAIDPGGSQFVVEKAREHGPMSTAIYTAVNM